jgi:lipopolysaccharide transport system permease protein
VSAITPAQTAAATSARVLRPRRGWEFSDLAKLWQFRELALCLAMRDIKVRYKQTALGALWAVIQPFTMMVVMSVFFGRLINLEAKTDGIPYPIFFYAGMLPWTFFAAAVHGSTNSLVANSHMLRKIYFPRLILPLSAVGAPLVDYAVAFSVLAGLMIWYGIAVTAWLAWLPLLVALTIIAALGVGVLLSAMTVKFRDFRYVVTFLIQVWFFITPVIYPTSIVGDRWRWLLQLNPMGGTIEAFRACVLGRPIDFPALLMSASVSFLCLLTGLLYFNHTERRFADVV